MFELAGSLALAAIPALPILAWILILDRRRPEPLGLVGRALALGLLAVLPAGLIEGGLGLVLPEGPGLPSMLTQSFIVAALVEEGVKLAFLKRFLESRPEFDEAADGMVYAIALSLGFAIAENFLYTWNRPELLLARSLTAVPLHAIATGLMGYQLGVGRLRSLSMSRGPESPTLPGDLPPGGWKIGLAIAVGMHGLYDFLLLWGGFGALLVLPLLALGALALRRRFVLAKSFDGRFATGADTDNDHLR
ncbi:MAG: PrsW family glutamic-type intramembrane protease [Spirochaetota bacterium]